MGKEFQEYFEESKIYVCKSCGSHLSLNQYLISKNFNGSHGRAFLIDGVINAYFGHPEERRLLTGVHITRDMFCKRCDTLIGWRYDKAYKHDQKYKEGKFILERNLVLKQEWA